MISALWSSSRAVTEVLLYREPSDRAALGATDLGHVVKLRLVSGNWHIDQLWTKPVSRVTIAPALL